MWHGMPGQRRKRRSGWDYFDSFVVVFLPSLFFMDTDGYEG